MAVIRVRPGRRAATVGPMQGVPAGPLPGQHRVALAELRAIALFDGLSDGQLLELAAVGAEVRCEPGQVLFREGQPAEHWWVLLTGTVRLLRQVGRAETVLATMDVPGQWAGGFRAWDERGVYLATGRSATGGRLLRVPAAQLRARADAWFPFGVHLIGGLVHTVRNIESVARQREALVALGRLAAGLAHEINNPASAATRAVDELAELTEAALPALAGLATAGLSRDQFAALDALRREIGPPTGGTDPLAVADLEDALSGWLAAHGVDRDWLIAPVLAAAGLDPGWCERVAALLGGRALAAGLEWIASSLSMASLLAEAKESTRRISSLIAAVRSYSQLDRASLQLTDLTEGLESTLVMLAHKLPGGVTVERDYAADVPRIEAYAAELNQVWTHLIDNAIDAMGGTGTLRLATRTVEGGVLVEVADTGRGMSTVEQAHAFEPFYTTKPVGEGTGLGLDVSRRIVVERHAGEIAVDSRPGATVLRVRLPFRPPRPAAEIGAGR
jgi:signal transduction histidine kinase